MMNKIILLPLALFPAFGMAQGGHFTLNGKIENVDAPAKVYLTYSESGKFIQDTATMRNGVFRFSAAISEPVLAQLTLDHKGDGTTNTNVDSRMLYLEKGAISVTGKDVIKQAAISGSKINADEKRYEAMLAAVVKEMDTVNEAYHTAKDAHEKSELKAKYTKLQEQLRIVQQQFITQNPDSYLSLVILQGIAGMENIDVPVMNPIYKSLSANVRHTPLGKRFERAVETTQKTGIGAMAPVFTQNDVNGKPVSLADFRGKYVLLDFWASWCGPCRAENPNVVKAYHTYKDKNFTVLGVSLDRAGKRDAWLAAIKADGLEWTQVSDLKFWENGAATLYGLKSIPQNFLIDPTGKIIGKNLRGEELTKKLASLFQD